jgi:hypothetical protein
MERVIDRSRFWEGLKHAFAVEQPGSVEPTPAQSAIVERVCREVVRRRLTAPALVALEMGRPLNFVTAQAIHFFDPVLQTFGDVHAAREFANFLEQRGSIDYLTKRIAEIDAAREETGPRESQVDG